MSKAAIYLSYFLLSCLLATALSGCLLDSPNDPSTVVQAVPVPAEKVQVLREEPANHVFSNVGQVKTARYNMFGIKRQLATVHSLLQAEAAKLGGNAIVNCRHIKDQVVADVIRFEDTV